jgi:hypothetical protein
MHPMEATPGARSWKGKVVQIIQKEALNKRSWGMEVS